MLSKETFQFLEDLKANNNREWFLDNKKRYDAFKKDYQQLIASFLEVLKPLDASLEMLEVKNCAFRINRDIRFSKDKSPYKTNLGFWFSAGAKNKNRAGYYVHLEKDKSFIAGGFYCPEAEDLKKMRREIAFFYDDLNAILADKKFKASFKNLEFNPETTLKNPPKGFEKDHPAIELLKLKSYVATYKIDEKAAFEKDFVSKTCEKLILLKPLNDFINRALTTE
jgi:uncharacterized protein (TIGR02453 family)